MPDRPPPATVELDAPTGTVVLHTPATCYVLRLDHASGTARHLHWGAPLPLADAAALPAWTDHDDSFAGPLDGVEEYPVEGGARFGAPALDVRLPDGTGHLRPRLDGARVVADGHLVIAFHDHTHPLAWELHYRVRPGTDLVERWTELTHTAPADPDAEPMLLLRCAAAHWPLPPRPAWRQSAVHGAWSREHHLERTVPAVGETTLTSRRGHTGHQSGPWTMLDPGHADEDRGEVWTAALATSGSWRLTLQRTPAGRAGVIASAGHEGVEIPLAPGGRHTTPVSVAAYTTGGFGAASRAFHGYVRAHVLPRPDEIRPVLYNSWEATSFEVNEDNQRDLARRAAALGAELFVVDDGWFTGRDADRSGLGDWTPHPRRFPRGLRPLADEVHRLGMAFGLWVEPEMVNADSDLFRRHPDWVLHLRDRPPTELRHQLVLDFSRRDVTDWAYTWLRRTIEDYDVDFLKWDFNRSFTEAASPAVPAAGRAARRVYVEHAEGVTGVLRRLRADVPRLRVESCAGGGGRTDLNILRHTDQVWTSDNTDAVDRLAVHHGFSQIHPAAVMSAWVTDTPNPLTGRHVPLRFRFHSAMAGVLGIGGDLTRWTRQDMDEAAHLVGLYKDIRDVVQHGHQYRLLAPGEGPLTAVQYVDPAADRAVVFLWRPTTSFAPAHPPLRLRGLDPAARYRDEDTGTHWSAATLTGHGLPLPALPPGDCASTVVRLRRDPAP